MTITERMFTIMENKNFKSVELAAVIGINTSVISTWKKRNNNPPAEYLFRICEFLDVSLSYLVTGSEAPTYNVSSNFDCVQFENTSQKIDYHNRVLYLKTDTIFSRYREAREAAGVSIQEAATCSYIPEDIIRLLEDDDIPTLEIWDRLAELKKYDFEQYAALAHKYNVDLFWLMCGKVRPPAAIVQDGHLAFPPYEFMMEGNERAAAVMPKPAPNYSHLELSEEEKELLQAYGCLTDEGKGWVYELILDCLKRQQKISYSPHTEGEKSRGGTA